MPSRVTTAVASVLPSASVSAAWRAPGAVAAVRARARRCRRPRAGVATARPARGRRRRARRPRPPPPATANAGRRAGGRRRRSARAMTSGGGTVAQRRGDSAIDRLEPLPHARRAAGHRCGRASTRATWNSAHLVARVGVGARGTSSIWRALVVVDRVERVRREQLGDLVGSQFTIHDPSIPRSSSCVAQPRQPGTYPALDGALRLVQDPRHLAVGVPAEVGELDGASFAVGQRGHRLPHLFGDVEVVGLEVEVVVGHDLGAGACAPRGRGAAMSDRMRSTQRACASIRRNERSEPRDWSKRSGCSQSRRKISCTISSASARSQSSRCASANTAPAWRR